MGQLVNQLRQELEDAVSGGGAMTVPPKSPQTVREKPTAAPAPTPTPATVQAAPTAPAPTASKAAQATAQAPAAPAPAAKGKTLTRMRGFVNCVERIQREDAMQASFLSEARALLDGEGHVILRLTNGFAEMMLDRDMLRRALSAELKREVADRDLQIEIAAVEADENDTVLDDIIAAAEN